MELGAVAKGFGDDQMQAFQRNVAELFLIAQQLGLHFDSMSFQTQLQSFVRWQACLANRDFRMAPGSLVHLKLGVACAPKKCYVLGA